MRIWMKRFGTGALVLLVALLLAPTIVPPFLDRIYYRGPPGAHFDGAHFFNPDGEPAQPGTSGAMLRFLMGSGKAVWPSHVTLAPGYPATAGTACPITPARATENWARCVPHPDPRRMFVTWIGHSTVLVQAGGLNILTDPIWAKRAGPFGLFGPARVRDPGIRIDDLPKIDLILVSHNHYDHMDLPTLKRLWDRDAPLIVTSLGNDAILKARGIRAVARDWGGRVPVRPGIDVLVERVHHWGSRWGKDRNRALWSGFTVTLPGGNLFFAGDTGFGDGSWPVAAARHGPFRLAILPIGAFEPQVLMAPSHIDPVQSVEVFKRLAAARALAVHWGTFQLSNEAIDAPPALLARTLARQAIAPDRFRTIEVGQPWEVPALLR
jgi:L-ascorbate metabolism protein UlaG (beta-lactamase superfamily)